MAITPQAIKDQEFQSKFRGYDPVEVKAYLDLVAEEFFELLEKVRWQEGEFAEMSREKELLEDVKKNLEADIEAALRATEDVRKDLASKDEREAERAKEIETFQTALSTLEQENRELQQEVKNGKGKVSEIEEQLKKSASEKDLLLNKVEMMAQQISELKDEEIDFKRTIGAAQRFADELKQESENLAEELQKSSEEKAMASLQAARDEIERLRQEAYAELSQLPEEINQLNQQRKQVRNELRDILTTYLEQLDSTVEIDESVRSYDYDELFQKIDIIEEPRESEESEDDLAEIRMELPLEEEADYDEDREELRNKLEEGGVAYLSGE